MEEILIAFMSKTLNIDKEQVAELVKNAEGELKETALTDLLNLDKERVSRLSKGNDDELKTRFDNGYAKAKGEVLGEFEKTIREKFEFQSDKKGFELVTDLVESRVSSLKKDGLTPDSIKKSSTYLDLVEHKNKEMQDKIDALTNDYDGKINMFKSAEVSKKITEEAFGIIDMLKPVLSEDLTRATNQKKSIVERILNTNKFEINEGRIILLNADGKIMEDEHKNPIPFDKMVRDTTVSLFDLKKSEERSSAGGPGSGADDKKIPFKWNGTAPTNDENYIKLISNADSLEEKQAITKAFNDSKASQ